MKSSFYSSWLLLALLTGCGLCSWLYADQIIAEKELPAAVLAEFHKQFPAARITQAALDKENNVTLYDIECIEGKIERDLLYSPEGQLVEVGQEIALSALPQVVTNVVATAYPKATLEAAEMKTRGSQILYEVECVVGKERHELLVSAEGQLLQSDEDDSDDKDEGEDD